VFQPGDRELQKRLALSTSVLRDADATAEESEEVSSSMTVEDIVMILLSKLEPSGVLDRWPALSCALFLRIFDALIISSQAIPLEQHNDDHGCYTIPKISKPSGPLATAAPAVPANATTTAVSSAKGSSFIPEYESGLCIIIRLLARFVENAQKTGTYLPSTAAVTGSSVAEFTTMRLEDSVSPNMTESSITQSIQGYSSWLAYRACQLYCHCTSLQVKEAACDLMLPAIQLVRRLTDKGQEKIRQMHLVDIRQLIQNDLKPLELFDVSLEKFNYNELQSTQGDGESSIRDIKQSTSRCLQTLESQGLAVVPPLAAPQLGDRK
jgi:hypothetical protein